jgi:hypothetical protein
MIVVAKIVITSGVPRVSAFPLVFSGAGRSSGDLLLAFFDFDPLP